MTAVVWGAVFVASGSHVAATVTIGGPFSLTAPDGRIVTDQTFRGKWLLVYFGYTSCPDSCPTTLVEVAKALAMLGTESDSVQPLFITIDPKHDTPEIMGAYTRSFDPRILGLTGTPAEIDRVVQAYGAYVDRRVGPDLSSLVLDHSTYLYMMNPNGMFSRALEHEPAAAQIVAALRVLMPRGAMPHPEDRKMTRTEGRKAKIARSTQ